ncbi:MAG TPA: hypothetical protein VGW78_00135 [Candidatus Babeliales bacterium]|jgi:hypothetical protein|nr:hypothetical protein [Candidatus Babeliales bacterium]
MIGTNKKVFLGICIMGTLYNTMESMQWPWGLNARKTSAIKHYGIRLQLDDEVIGNKIGILRAYTRLSRGSLSERERIEDSIEGLKNAAASMILRMQKSRDLRNDFIRDIQQATSQSDIEKIQTKYYNKIHEDYANEEIYSNKIKPIKSMLEPEILLKEFKLPNLESVNNLSHEELAMRFKGYKYSPKEVMYSAKEQTWGERIKHWFSTLFAPGPSGTMELTQTPEKKHAEIPTSYRDYIPQTPTYFEDIKQLAPAAWEISKQWAGQLKTRAKSALEKKAEKRLSEERYIPAGWVVDPWQ